jgi:hypothetical protein
LESLVPGQQLPWSMHHYISTEVESIPVSRITEVVLWLPQCVHPAFPLAARAYVMSFAWSPHDKKVRAGKKVDTD